MIRFVVVTIAASTAIFLALKLALEWTESLLGEASLVLEDMNQ